MLFVSLSFGDVNYVNMDVNAINIELTTRSSVMRFGFIAPFHSF